MKLAIIPRVFLLLICVFFILTGCSLTSKKTMSSASVDSDNRQNFNKLLLKQKYEISKNNDKKILYLLHVEDGKITSEEHEVDNNGTLTLNIEKNKEFILSMPSGKNTLYSWNIGNEVDESLINFKISDWIKPFKFTNIIYQQDKYRQNFHMEVLRTGKQTIEFTYYSKKKKSQEFNIAINFDVK